MDTEQQADRVTEVFGDRRRWTRFYPDPMAESVSLFVDGETSYSGLLSDESFAGIGVQFREDLPVTSNQHVEVLLRDARVAAVVRHIRNTDQGHRLGLEWRLVEPLRGDGSDWGIGLMLKPDSP